MKRIFLAAAALASLAAACAVSPSADESTAKGSSPIINGKDSPNGIQDAVVLLTITDGAFGACSGTLLAPNLVLTARHCVSKTADQPFACDITGKLLGGGTQVGADHPPNTIAVHVGNQRPAFGSGPVTPAARGAKIFHNGSKTLCNADIALVLLDANVEGGTIAPVRIDAPPVVNESFTAVGWGVTVLDPFPDVRQQRENVRIKHVGPYENFSEAVPPNEFQIGEAICSGDSGGPAMATTSGAVLGVVSRGGNGTSNPNDPAAGCMGGTNFYTRVDGFRDMILEAYAESGQDPWVEGGADPRLAKLGATCSADGDCRTNICLTSKAVCSQDCSADACPAGYQCGTDNGRQACIPIQQSSGGCATSGGTESSGVGLGLAALFAIAALRKRRG